MKPPSDFERRVRTVLPIFFVAFLMGASRKDVDYVGLMIANELEHAVNLTALFFMLPTLAACFYLWCCDQAQANLMKRANSAFDESSCRQLWRSTRALFLLLSVMPVYSGLALVQRLLG